MKLQSDNHRKIGKMKILIKLIPEMTMQHMYGQDNNICTGILLQFTYKIGILSIVQGFILGNIEDSRIKFLSITYLATIKLYVPTQGSTLTGQNQQVLSSARAI